MVREIRRASYAEVIGYWVDLEYRDRPEFKELIDSYFSKDYVRRIEKPHDYNDKIANRKRFIMLGSFQPFVSWFSHAKWSVVLLSKRDLSNLLVIHALH